MKILLVSANTLKEPFPIYPLGLDHVAASIHARHQVYIEDLIVLPDTGSLARRVMWELAADFGIIGQEQRFNLLIDALADAGLKHVAFGTDTLSKTVLRSNCKPFAVKQVPTDHGAALTAGCHVAHYLLLGGPGETLSTLQETLDHIDTLRKTVLFFSGRIRPVESLSGHTVFRQSAKPQHSTCGFLNTSIQSLIKPWLC